MIKVIQLPSFCKKAKKIFSDDEISELCSYLEAYPNKGDVIAGTGGVRKLRWASGNKGKRGGARVIYFYHVSDTEIYLISVYSKSKKVDLNSSEKTEVKKLVEYLKSLK